MNTHFKILDYFKSLLDQNRPLDPAIVSNLREDLIVRWTYHSNAIEGNPLTLWETKIVPEGITVRQSRTVPRAHRRHRERKFSALLARPWNSSP